MTQRISGPGQSLPAPANLYPSYLQGTPYDAPMNYVGLAGGDAIYFPALSNDIWVEPGAYSMLQFLDPVTGVWRDIPSHRGQAHHIPANGSQSLRVANLTGCPVAAIIAGGGSGFAQATATITANVGGSTWQAIVGGSLSVSTIAVVGANYTIAPLVMIPVPPAPGVQATAHAIIASGTVSSIVLDNVGAGYLSAPIAVIEPSPFDTATNITQATVTLILNAGNAAKITAALCTNNGAPLATLSALTLTAAGGAGTGATITPLVMQSCTLASVVAGGAGWGTATAFAKIFSSGGGGNVSVSAIGNPAIEATGFRPRTAEITGTTNAGGTITAVTILDGGLFLSAPAVGGSIMSGGTLPTTAASVALTMGAQNDTVLIQPM